MMMLRRSITSLLCVSANAGLVAAVDVEGDCEAPNDDGSFVVDDFDVVPDWRRPYKCEDTEDECMGWASLGACANNPTYMLVYCPISCDSCPEPFDFSDEEENLLDAVTKYGKPQKVVGTDTSKIIEAVRKTMTYMQIDESIHNLSDKVLNVCTNQEELCTFWAAIGECEKNKKYMKTMCSPSCQTCEVIDVVEPTKENSLDYQKELELARKEIAELKTQLNSQNELLESARK